MLYIFKNQRNMKRLLMLTAVLMMLITAVRGNEIVTLHVTRVVGMEEDE